MCSIRAGCLKIKRVKKTESNDVTLNVAVHNCNVADVVNQRFINYFDTICYSAGEVDVV